MFSFNDLLKQIKENDPELKTVSLETIDLQQKHLDAKQLFKSLKKNEHVQTLELMGNTIDDKGATKFAKILASNTPLKRAYLGDNGLGDKGVEPIALALANNTTLEELDLNSNRISDQGAALIANALSTNRYLTEIELANNDITHVGFAKCRDALSGNTASALKRFGALHNIQSSEATEILGEIAAICAIQPKQMASIRK